MSTKSSLSTRIASPIASSTVRTSRSSSVVTAGAGHHTVAPYPIWAGVFGIERTTRSCRSPDCNRSIVAPATIDRTTCSARSRPARSRIAASSVCGFTESTTRSASLAAAALSGTVSSPNRATSSCRRRAFGSPPVSWCTLTDPVRSSAAAIASAITPQPIKAIRLPLSGDGCCPTGRPANSARTPPDLTLLLPPPARVPRTRLPR